MLGLAMLGFAFRQQVAESRTAMPRGMDGKVLGFPI
jgi:hypothetical protein